MQEKHIPPHKADAGLCPIGAGMPTQSQGRAVVVCSRPAPSQPRGLEDFNYKNSNSSLRLILVCSVLSWPWDFPGNVPLVSALELISRPLTRCSGEKNDFVQLKLNAWSALIIFAPSMKEGNPWRCLQEAGQSPWSWKSLTS